MSDDEREEIRTKVKPSGTSARIRIPLGKRMKVVLEQARARILQMEDVCFGTDRCILLPALPELGEPEDPRGQRDGLAVAAAAMAFSQLHPERFLLVAGHTDSVGSKSYNLELSEKRAANVLLYLQGEQDKWAAHCDEHFARADFKRVHLWAATMLGWDCDPGPLNEAWNGHTKAARDVFRRNCEEELGVTLEHNVEQNPGDWSAIYGLYERHLAKVLRVKVEELTQIREGFKYTDPAAIGCGEAWPVDALGVDEHASADNRRVDLLFFDEDEIPDDLGGDPPGLAVYGQNAFKPEYIPVGAFGDPAGLADFELLLELRDHWIVERVASKDYKITGPLPDSTHVREGTTDANGRLREMELAVGEYLVECDGGFTVAGSRLTRLLRSDDDYDVHRLHGHSKEVEPTQSIEYEDPWVVPQPGDFVDHALDEDFDEEEEGDEDEDEEDDE